MSEQFGAMEHRLEPATHLTYTRVRANGSNGRSRATCLFIP
jgi:hypothetical protein